jgi:hypothetical protein
MSFQLGPCQIYYDGADIGATEGGVTIKLAEDSADLKSDQTGTQPVDVVITGVSATIECSLAEVTLDKFAFAHKTTVITDGAKQKVLILPNVGTSLRDNAKVLVVKPYIDGVVSADPNTWYTFNKAGIKAEEEVSFDASTQRVLKLTFMAFADDNGYVAILGDESAV